MIEHFVSGESFLVTQNLEEPSSYVYQIPSFFGKETETLRVEAWKGHVLLTNRVTIRTYVWSCKDVLCTTWLHAMILNILYMATCPLCFAWLWQARTKSQIILLAGTDGNLLEPSQTLEQSNRGSCRDRTKGSISLHKKWLLLSETSIPQCPHWTVLHHTGSFPKTKGRGRDKERESSQTRWECVRNEHEL